MEKRNKIIYWIATIWLSLGMFSTGLVQLFKARSGPSGADSLAHLGYPGYFLLLIGVWKILGVVAVLVPHFPRLKEWAYAGFFFAMSGAVISHLALGDHFAETFPSILLLVLTSVSWYFRPASRKLILTVQ
ncbi:MAG TPA: DoxX family protein [Puia sp.]|nr:DoxX family protein [Puia sp.]